jgi:flagellar biosynthesis protein FlhB
MSESKPYDATPAKREKARREGNVARSQEACVVAAFAAAGLATLVVAPILAGEARAALVAAARGMADAHATSLALVVACAPMLAAACAGAAVAIAQGGGLHVRPVAFAPKHLAPLPNLKRMLGGEAVVGALRASLAFAAALLVGGFAIRDAFATALRGASVEALTALVADAAERTCAGVLAVGAAFAAAEYALAHRRRLRELKMSHDEMKRDMREQDGDPHAKAKRKHFHRALVRGSLQRVAEAAFVVVNPTHVAIALAYDPPRIGVPEILVRAADDGAARVRALAREHGVPIVEDIALARALFAEGEVGRPIPPSQYLAAAHVVAELARAGVLS